MQYAKKAAGRFECNDGVIGFGHRMSVGRIDMVVCVNCGNRNVVRDVMMMAGTDDTDGSLSKSRIGAEDGPCRNYGQAQIKHRMVPAETTDRRR